MATKEFIQKRIEGKEKEIVKLEKKIERILKAKETGWEVNPYYYSESDLRWTNKYLEEAKVSLAKYQAELETENEKAASRNIQVIIEFLERWKEAVTKFYLGRFEKYPEAYEQYLKDMQDNKIDFFEERKLKRENPEAFREYERTINEIKESFKNNFGFLTPYIERTTEWKDKQPIRGYSFDSEKLKKELDAEADRKYDFIIERTNHIVKVITDASGLEIGAKGDLNGVIIGTNGKAKVQTIGAGGYNIQCFHFRTLINRTREA